VAAGIAPFWAACSLFLPTLLFGSLSGPIRAAEPASSPLALERIISFPSVSGRIDHMAVDLRRGCLFVAELGNGTVDVVDLAAGKATHRIAGLKEPQGVGYSPQANVIAVASAGLLSR